MRALRAGGCTCRALLPLGFVHVVMLEVYLLKVNKGRQQAMYLTVFDKLGNESMPWSKVLWAWYDLEFLV